MLINSTDMTLDYRNSRKKVTYFISTVNIMTSKLKKKLKAKKLLEILTHALCEPMLLGFSTYLYIFMNIF